MKPLVSVYILNYNYGKYLRQCIESVLEQTYKNIEILIIDDGSTDCSKQILKEYNKKKIRKIIFQENIGLIKSIIKAFDISKGKYVIRVDADDWIDKNLIKYLVTEIEKDHKVAMIFPDYYEVNERGLILHRIKRHDFSTEVTMLDQPAHGACTLIRRDAYFEVGGHDTNLECQDGFDIWLSIIKSFKVLNFKKPLFFYRKHNNSITTNIEKLLNNRSVIFRNHAKKRGYKKKSLIAFIPVRSQIFNNQEFCLNFVGDSTLLDITIKKALKSTEVTSIVVSTDSLFVTEYVIKNYSNIEIHKRDKNLTQEGMHINESIRHYFLSKKLFDSTQLVVLTTQYPFSTFQNIDTALFSSYLFNTDIVDSVIEDTSIIYYHDGQGMKKLHSGEIRKERDLVYFRKGGITFYSKKAINNLLQNKLIVNGIGHVVIAQKAAFEVVNNESLKIANMMNELL